MVPKGEVKVVLAAAARDGGANKKRKKPAWTLDSVIETTSAFASSLWKWVLLHHMAIMLGILALSIAYILRYNVKRASTGPSSLNSRGSSRGSSRSSSRGSSSSGSSSSSSSKSSGGSDSDMNSERLQRAATKAPIPLRLLDAVSHTKHTVQTVEYKVGGTFLHKLAEEGQPALIKNSPVKDWGIFSWNLMELSKNNTDFVLNQSYVKTDKNPVFVIGMERDRGGMLGSIKDTAVMFNNAPFRDFLQLMFDHDVHMFYTGSVESWEKALNVTGTGTRSGKGSMGDWAALAVNEKANDAPSRAEVHLAHPAMVLQTNFKPRHIVINQVQGYKRVIIYQPGPGVAAHEYLYPNIHRAFAYSQLHLEEFDADTHVRFFPKFGRKPALIDVTLGPGDSLYIPPYWAVRQECITLSLAIHVESPSSPQNSFSEVFSQNLHLEDWEGSQELRSLAVALLLHDIVAKATAPSTNWGECISTPNMTLQRLSATIVETRFAPFMALHALGRQLPKSLDNGKACFPPSIHNDSHIQDLLRNSSQTFDAATNRVVLALCRAPTHASIKERILMDYVEQLVRWATSPRYSGAYLIDCLSKPSVMQSMLALTSRAHKD